MQSTAWVDYHGYIHVHNRHVPPQLEPTSGLPYLLSLLATGKSEGSSLNVQSVGQLPLLLQPLSAPAQYVPPSTGSSVTVACTLYFSGDHSGSVPRSTIYYYASAYSPAALHVITRAQFLSPISISTPYPAPHLPQRFTRFLKLGFLTVYIAPHLPTQAWPIKVTHSIPSAQGDGSVSLQLLQRKFEPYLPPILAKRHLQNFMTLW